jgi:hypothetical protein
MRRFLRSIACAWIVCQLIAVASPLALTCDSFGIDQPTCCPGVGPGQICPMHHKTAGDRNTCKLESTCGHRDTLLLTMIAIGILPPSSVAGESSSAIARVDAISESTLSRAFVPDLPPPRLCVHL